MGFEKGSKEWAFCADFFELLKRFWKIPDQLTEEFWQELIKETDDFARKHSTPEDKTAVQLASIIVQRCDDQARHVLPLCDVSSGTRLMLAALIDRGVEV